MMGSIERRIERLESQHARLVAESERFLVLLEDCKDNPASQGCLELSARYQDAVRESEECLQEIAELRKLR